MSDASKGPQRKPLSDIDRERAVREIRRRAERPGYIISGVSVESVESFSVFPWAGPRVSVEVTYEQADPRGVIPSTHDWGWTEPLDELIGASLDHEESVLVADEKRLRDQTILEQDEFGDEKPETVKRREGLSKRRVQHVNDRIAHLRPDSRLRDYAAAAANMAPLQSDSDMADAIVPVLREDLMIKASAKVASELTRFKEGKDAPPPPIGRLQHDYRSALRLTQSALTAQLLGDDGSITTEGAPEAIFERIPGTRNPKKQEPQQISSDTTRTTPQTTRAKRRKPVGPDLRKQRGVSDTGTENRSVPSTPPR